MSYYALFQWWLLLSQHPGCYCAVTPFHTELGFGDLSCGSGLFPFRRRSLAPAVSLTLAAVVAFAVCLGLVTSTWPLAHAVLYLQDSHTGWLYLNTFRGEPAISTFGWNFSSIHNSSPSFATLVSSSLDEAVTSASLWSWIAHVVSGRIAATVRLLQTRLPSGSPALPLVNHATCDALAGSFYKRHAISPYLLIAGVASDCW